MNLVPQFGFFELVLVAIVALIVVGPKDLPRLMRSAGQMVAKARRLAGEFTAAFDQMAREAEMEDLRKEIEDLKKNNPVADAKRAVEESIAPIDKDLRDEVREINRAASETPKSQHPAAPQKSAEPEAAAESEPFSDEPAAKPNESAAAKS